MNNRRSITFHLPRAQATHNAGQGARWVLLFCILPALLGCKPAQPSQEPTRQSSLSEPNSNVTRIHWLGKKRIAGEGNAAGFMKIWNLPQTAGLESQTIDKLALALTQLNHNWITNHHGLISNYSALLKGPSAYLRPLLRELLDHESYWELTSSSNNEPRQIAFAIKLDDSRSAAWQSNLLAAASAWPGAKLTKDKNGHLIQLSPVPWLLGRLLNPGLKSETSTLPLDVELRRVANWTLVGFGQKNNALLRDFQSRIERDRAPFQSRGTNFWLEVNRLSLAHLQGLIGFDLAEDLPKLSFNIIGDGENVRTRGTLDFSKPLAVDLEPWIIPTNLISTPLTSFTAIRGLKSFLSLSKTWSALKLDFQPNQMYTWALQGIPSQTYFAIPARDASNVVSTITEATLQRSTAFFATNEVVKFERAEPTGLHWRGLPAIDPFLKWWTSNDVSFVLGGVFVLDQPVSPPPADLLNQLTQGATNLVYYDWELTGPRSEQCDYIAQFIRFGKYRLQMHADLASRAVIDAASPLLGNCGTVVTLTEPNALSFSRRSMIGLTAMELHLLADWLESPNFPLGLRSSIPAAPNSNSPPASASAPAGR
jgi:hypothetical protein